MLIVIVAIVEREAIVVLVGHQDSENLQQNFAYDEKLIQNLCNVQPELTAYTAGNLFSINNNFNLFQRDSLKAHLISLM